MIIGYDFWADDVYPIENQEAIIPSISNNAYNDGVAFDNCGSFNGADSFTLMNGKFDELNVTKDSDEMNENTEKTEWTINNVLLARFNDDLAAGTISIGGQNISHLAIKKRKKGDDIWQTFYVIEYDSKITTYKIIDKLIESGETYEYCVYPMAVVGSDTIYGDDTSPKEIYISYDHAHIFDNTNSFDLIYDVKFGNISLNIGANTIDTLGSQYPYVVYGQNNYKASNFECLLVTEESAIGSVDFRAEKQLREKIISFLTNKQHKIIKNADGIYMLIDIIDTPTLIPNNDILGVYQVSFNYVEIGSATSIRDLSKCGFKFDYFVGDDGVRKTTDVFKPSDDEIVSE